MKRHSRLDYVLVTVAGLSAGMITMLVITGVMSQKKPALVASPTPTPTASAEVAPIPPPPPPIPPTPKAAPPAPPPPPPTEDPLVAIRRLIETGDLAGAKERLKGVLDREPSAKAMALLALAHIRGNEVKEAAEALSRTSLLDGNLPELPFYQGHLDMVRGDFDGARRAYDEALHRRPGDPGVLAARATVRYHLGEFAGAIDDATQAIKADSKYGDAFFTRAVSYDRMSRFNEALRDYNAFLALRPRDVTGYMNRAKVHLALQQRVLAMEDWKKAIEIQPDLKEELRALMDEVEK